MSPALSLIVFGQVYLLAPIPNNISITPDTNLTTTIDQHHIQPEPLHAVRRNDYTYTPGIGAHKVHLQAATWNNARKSCQKEGGYIAIINSAAEAEHLALLAKNAAPYVANSHNTNYVRIGFHDLYRDDEFVTIHGESLTAAGYANWEQGQPQGNGEDCGAMNINDGKLHDISCMAFFGFICELQCCANTVACEAL